VNIAGMTGDQLVEMMDRRIGESKGFWDGKDYELEKTTKANERYYFGKQVSDLDDSQDKNLSLDNRIFSSIRTIVPYVTSRITEPEGAPSSTSEEAKRFAEDIEKALYIHVKKQNLKRKVKFALEDAIIRRRGYLKLRYDAVKKNFCAIEYVPAESIIVDHKARTDEELRYFRHVLDKTPEDLITMFPDMKAKILDTFQLDENSPRADMQKSYQIHEDWCFVPGDDGLDLICSWSYNKVCFGAVPNPNWLPGKQNFIDYPQMPLIEFNVLADGRTHIDRTSFVEQAKYLQSTIDQRGRQIGVNAGLGNIGMPVVDAAALADDQAEYVQFEPDTVLELDVSNAGKQSINDVFTTWKAGTLSPDVYKDKQDAVEGVQNTFGASNVNQGNESDNKTLGQDELLRDQSVGRQQEIVDAIDVGMARLYPLVAQFLFVYGQEQELFKFVGENAEFDYVIMHTDELDVNAEMQIKAGTSMPIDNPQRRATADKAAASMMIDPLTYWEIMDEPNAQKYAKRVADWTANPTGFLQDTQEEVFDRDAYVDIQMLKAGQQPPYRDELSKEYFDYLNHYVLSGDLENPNIDIMTRQVISQFIDIQLARGQKMLGMAETQLPTPQDVAAHNMQVDAANSAPPPPMQPGAPGQPPQRGAAPKPVQ